MAGDTIVTNISVSSRDGFLDVARGVCMLSIVFIHTTFWTGYNYVPSYMQSISLFLINVILTVVILEGLRYCYTVFGLFFGLFKLENKQYLK